MRSLLIESEKDGAREGGELDSEEEEGGKATFW